MSQEIQARLEKVQEELRALQGEMSVPGTSYLSLDVAVSAVICAWHLQRKERGLAKHNFENVKEVVPKLEFLFGLIGD
jgi:hypothetical protein